MKKKFVYLFLCLLSSIGFISAQTTSVRGVVLSADDSEPIIGASILAKGTTVGTVTDYNGAFTLDVPSSAKTLIISYIGMVTKEVTVAANVSVQLASDTKTLDEIVVTGYGNFKKSSFTGSASSVSTEKVRDIPAISVQSRLAGAVSGVQITSTSGQPGAVESVRIRGVGSMNASNDPLYVIDGVPMMSGNASLFSYDDAGNSMLSSLNSNDIETMTVIKDAAAASLYGSRAANGVIVITTKKGSAGKTKFSAKADWGFSDMAIDYRPTLNGSDRRDLLHLGLKNYQLNDGKTEADAIAYADKEIDKYAAEPWSGYTDWKDILFRKGTHQNYEVNSQGGNDKTKFYTSLSYMKHDGITLQSGFERYTGRLNLSHTADRVTFDGSVLFSVSDQDVASEATSFASPFLVLAMAASPSAYPYNEDGSFSNSFPALNGANPLQTATYNYNKNKVTRTLSSFAVTWNIWDNLNIMERISYDFNQSNNRVWWDPRSNDGRSSKGVYQRYMTNRNVLNTQSQLTYNKSIAQKHNIDVLLGFETESYKRDYTYSNGSNYPHYQEEITNAATTRASSSYSEYRLASYLGRVNYDYMSKYYLSASMRRDGSSRLSRDSRWGNFWSVSGSWRLSQESFMESLSGVITDAKVRASYGINGTQPSDYYSYLGLFRYGYNYNGSGGSSEAILQSNDLKWEKNYATNIGIDVTLLKRFGISLEWYNRNSKDLLVDRPISGTVGIITSSGTASRLVNVGSMNNKGIELELKSTNIQTKDVFWSSSLSLAHNKNKLTKLADGQDQMIDVNATMVMHKVGEPYNSFYAYEYAGVDPATGKESFYLKETDENGKRKTTTKIAEAEKTIIGNADATVMGGITNFVSWKFIDFNLTLTYSLGGNAFDRGTWIQSNGGSYHYNGNIPSFYKIEDMWKNPGDNAKLPQFAYGNSNYSSSRWMFSTDHLRVKNVTLGFTIPQNVIRPTGLNKVRAYVSGSNLLTWKSKDLTVDPETPATGLVRFESPAEKTITFGIEVGF